ncbi:PREDICTED: double-stranded RNA-specific editase 1 [Papilio xuthus]|uniref:Double-stranded RNA-specific editase 1 n=1 Tax=Papilio xuthus TaxID=66420 RepID=A0AAJ6ZKM0_PAPXU|nr:PREDICTED: double-stranded RNA-specific editase 1 [Papilio xuthus]
MANNSADTTGKDNLKDWDPSISSSTDIKMPDMDVDKDKKPSLSRPKSNGPAPKRLANAIPLDGFKWNMQALATAAEAVESGGKSPVSALNELGVRVNYTLRQQGGPPHCPSFVITVEVADMKFEGFGHSKREARAAAARACLSALMQRAGRLLPAPSKYQDFTSDDPSASKATDGPCSPICSPSTSLFGSRLQGFNKSPINMLYENYPGLSFICTYGDGSSLDSEYAPLQLSHSMRFKVICKIKDYRFEGYGSSKKLAKVAAARVALAELGEARAGPQRPLPAAPLNQLLADHVARLVNDKFQEMVRNNLIHSKRKVLAGIVLTIDNGVEGAKVIAVTTGTKCVSGEHMSVKGLALNDCHAEVAARRCLQRYLYSQLLLYASASDPKKCIPESDIEPIPTGGYQLKPDRSIHLYVSTAPCGDGRIFSPHENNESELDRHPNRLARGQLRTKIESGEGTIPVKNSSNVVQTWDGVLQGERLLTMSCSDKAARWCVVGLQGSLLACLLRPVYLSSLVLGSLLHPQHLYRAICGRIENYISSLPPPYRLQRLKLARAASTEARTATKAPSISVCWCCTSPMPEVINATTGKLDSGQPSLLCKQSMFARWQYLITKLPLLPQESDEGPKEIKPPADLANMQYFEAKQICTTYQAAKERLTIAFEKANLGRWIKKPIEQDHFVCDIVNPDPRALFA